MQGLLCGVLQVVVQKLNETDASKASVMQAADQSMDILLKVFAANQATVHEEAMLAVGALTYACGASFAKYLTHLFPIIEMGLRNTAVGPLPPPLCVQPPTGPSLQSSSRHTMHASCCGFHTCVLIKAG